MKSKNFLLKKLTNKVNERFYAIRRRSIFIMGTSKGINKDLIFSPYRESAEKRKKDGSPYYLAKPKVSLLYRKTLLYVMNVLKFIYTLIHKGLTNFVEFLT